MGAWQLLCCAMVVVAGKAGPNFLSQRTDEAWEASWWSGGRHPCYKVWSMSAHDKAGDRRCLCGVDGACIFVASEWCAAIIAVRLRSGVMWLHRGRRMEGRWWSREEGEEAQDPQVQVL